MSDRRKPTPACDPSDFDPGTPLRETYARQIRPEDRARLEALCASVLQLTREAPMIVKHISYGGILDELRAAAAELRYVAGFLAWVGTGDGNELSRAEHRLADSAERIGSEIGGFVAGLEAAIAKPGAES